MDFFKSFFDFTKLPTKIFLVVSIVTGVFIFSSAEVLKKLHLDKFEAYEGFVGLAFLFSAVLVLINFIIWLFNKIDVQYRIIKLRKEFQQLIENLDYKEKAVLREFAIQGQNSIEMPFDDNVVSGLINKKILRYNKQFGNAFIANGSRVSMFVDHFFVKMIKPEHIDLKLDYTEEDEAFYRENRPEWVKKHLRY